MLNREERTAASVDATRSVRRFGMTSHQQAAAGGPRHRQSGSQRQSDILEKKPRIRRKKREILVSLLFFLPRKQKLVVDYWLRGRKEYGELMEADYVIVSPPRSGRTWLRMMLSRFFQIRYGLPEDELLGYHNYHQRNPAIPRIRFTHDRYIGNYTGHRDSKCDFYPKKVILLVRDPRDVVVSNYFQWINTVNPYKIALLNLPEHPAEVPIFEFAMMPRFGISRTIDFLKAWAPELKKTRSHLLIRYEDMRAEPARIFADILAFMQIHASPDEIDQVVRWSSFENMRTMEQKQTFDDGSRRLMLKDPNNPDAFKVRRGKVGGYCDYFAEHELEVIDRLIAALPPVYGYTANARCKHPESFVIAGNTVRKQSRGG
jgi:hypothetical protein